MEKLQIHRVDFHPFVSEHGRERGHYGSFPAVFAGTKDGRRSVGYERLPRGATTLNGCVKAICTPSPRYSTFFKFIFFTRLGALKREDRALKGSPRVGASIFAHRLKLLNVLPSFSANFAPARKRKAAEGRLGARTPTRTRTSAAMGVGSRTAPKTKPRHRSSRPLAAGTHPILNPPCFLQKQS